MNSASISASALIKIAANLTAEQTAQLSDQPGWLSEALIFPNAYRRAGRASAIAEAAGQRDIPLSVKHPMTSRALSGLGTGLIGGAAGAILGQALAPHGGALPGGILGAAGGTWVGALIDSRIRKNRADQIFNQLGTKSLDADRITMPSRAAALAAGVHSQGKADVAQALTDGRSSFSKNPAMTGAQAAGLILANAGMVPGMQHLGAAAQLAAFGQMGGSVSLQRDARHDIRNAQA